MKTQLDGPAPAEELFCSELFRRRRRFAQGSGCPWFVLSSRYGLLAGDEVVEPYDLPLDRQPVAYRRLWGEGVVAQLETAAGDLRDVVVEVHAGAAHIDPLRVPLERARARILAPLQGLTQGRHLAWYAAAGPFPPMPGAQSPR